MSKSAEIENSVILGAEFLKHFTLVLNGTLLVISIENGFVLKGKDPMNDLAIAVELTRVTKNRSRFLYQPLSFLKQHRNLFCHQKGCRVSNVEKTLNAISSIIVWLNLYSSNSRLLFQYIEFYEAYFDCAMNTCFVTVAKENFDYISAERNKPKEEEKVEDGKAEKIPAKMTVSKDFDPFKEDSAISSLLTRPSLFSLSILSKGPIPKTESIKWFKSNGLSIFLKEMVVIPEDTNIAGLVCKIERYNGNNCLVRVLTPLSDEESANLGLKVSKGRKYISAFIRVEWKDELSKWDF